MLTVLVQTFPLVFCAIWRFSQDILHLWLFLILFTEAEVDEETISHNALESNFNQHWKARANVLKHVEMHIPAHTSTRPNLCISLQADSSLNVEDLGI